MDDGRDLRERACAAELRDLSCADKASPLDHTEEAFGVHVEGDTAHFVNEPALRNEVGSD